MQRASHARNLLLIAAFGALVAPAFLPGPWASAEAGSSPPQVPCQIEGVCPDLIVDPLIMARSVTIQTRDFSEASCSVVEGHVPGPGTHKLLRFTFNTPNLGPGDLVVGRPSDHPEWFEYAPCHNHYHFREYADYRLWTMEGYQSWVQARLQDPLATAQELFDADPGLLDGFVAGHKQGFCVIDLTMIGGLPISGVYRSCNDQGISAGWADEYYWGLDGQWIVINDVPPGLYMLEAEVDAERLYVETQYANNAWAVPVRI